MNLNRRAPDWAYQLLLRRCPGVELFRVAHIARVFGVDAGLVNYYIRLHPGEFPFGEGIEGEGCRREWYLDDAARVVAAMVMRSVKCQRVINRN